MKKFLKVLIVIAIILILFICVDYFRYKEHKRPIFARFEMALLDGGTVEYWGLGYKIIYFNRLDDQFFNENLKFKYMGPIWVDYDEAYEKCTSNVLSNIYKKLYTNEKAIYMILKKIYPTDEVDQIFLEKEKNELNYYYKLMDIYNNEKLNEEDKKWLHDEIKYYYSQNMNKMKNEEKGKFDIFFYGMDYTGIDY